MSRYRTSVPHLAILAILILLSFPVSCQCSVDFDYPIWWKTFGGRNYDSGESITRVDENGFAISGRTQGFDVLPLDDQAWLVRCDLDGNHVWNKTYGGGIRYGGFMSSYLHSVTVINAPDGGFLLTSHTTNFGPGEVNGWLIHTDENGECLWNYTYGGEHDIVLVESIVCSEGGFLSIGVSMNETAGVIDGWVLRTDANGNHQWNKTYGSPEVGEVFYDVIELVGGRYVMTGGLGEFSYIEDRGSDQQDAWLCCIDADGNHLWNQTYGGSNLDRLDQIIQCKNGDLAICGRTISHGMGEFDTWLVRTDSNGQLLWNQTYGTEVIEVGLGLEECQDGGFAIFTLTYNETYSKSDGWFVRTDSAGVSLWDPIYGGENFDQFWGGVRVNDGFIAIGITQSFGAGMSDMWIVKIPDIPENNLLWIIIIFGSTAAIVIVLATILLKEEH